MLKKNAEVVNFLQSRRSRPAKTLIGPAPTQDQLKILLTAAARTPDHGKLEPWRFMVFEEKALKRLVELIVERGKQLNKGPEK